ncbi:MAG TPA: hypothetical protein VMS00_12540, partial [Acidimicrobiales bacterium]|nr:hypothetical protein [Acidimicrobiales bacterium]
MHTTAANGNASAAAKTNASTVTGNDGGFERGNGSSGDEGWARPRLATLLLVADGRFPAGGYAHSGGLEEAVKAGRVHDEATLLAFLAGRLQTAGVVEAHLAVAAWSACAPAAALGEAFASAAVRRVDAEAAARCPSAALR